MASPDMATPGGARSRESASESLADASTLEAPYSDRDFGSQVVGTTSLYENGQIRLIPVRLVAAVTCLGANEAKAPSPDPNGQHQPNGIEPPPQGTTAN